MRIRPATFLIIPLLVPLGGCSGSDDAGIASIFNEIRKTRAELVIWDLVKWMLLGALAGIVLASAAFFLAQRLGGYRWEWRHARWLRLLTFILMLVLCSFFLGAVGHFEGLLRGSETALRHSQLGTQVLPEVSNSCADLLLIVHDVAPQAAAGKTITMPADALAAFRQGKRDLDVPEFLSRVDKLGESVASTAATQLKAEVLDRAPSWKGGVAEDMLDWVLKKLSRKLLEKNLRDRMKEHGIAPFLDDLRTEAGRQPNQRMGRTQLASFFQERVITPAILRPIRDFVRHSQLAMLGLVAVAILVPILLFRLAEHLRRRWYDADGVPSK